MGKGTRKSTRNGIARQYAFYMIEPKERANADRFARKLIGCKRVREVYVTEGACGFIVKAVAPASEEVSPIPASVINGACRKVGLAISRYTYRK